MLFALSSPIPILFQELQQFFKTSEGAQLIQSCTHDQQQPNLFSVCNGMLFSRHQLFLSASYKFREKILHEMHESPTNGHSSLKPTLARIAASFYWPGWTQDVKQFLQQCVTCQRNKYMPKKIQGLLQPPPTLAQIWEDLSMDFLTHLPSSAGHTMVCDVIPIAKKRMILDILRNQLELDNS